MRQSLPVLALLASLAFGPGMAGCSSGAVAESIPVDDVAITRGVKAALGRSTELTAAEIDVATSEGIVQLSGFVSSADSVSTAASVARTVKGVKSVRNDLRLK